MRLSTMQIYSRGSDAIGHAQSEMFANQQRISLGKRIVSPADDPVGAAAAVVTGQAKARVTEYAANIGTAADQLSLQEAVLGDVSAELADMRTMAVNAGSGSLTDADRASLAGELEQRLSHLVSLANSRGADGGYLFSGFQVETPPFAMVGGRYVYQGDQGQRMLAVASGRDIAVNANGESLFNAVRTGNGTFVATASAGNTGSGLVSGGSVKDPAALTGHNYSVKFTVMAGVTTFDLFDDTVDATAAILPAARPYVSGQAIVVDGMQVEVSGSPASGDAFTLSPGTRQSVFTTIQDLVATLRVASGTAGAPARVANGIGLALQNLSQAQESVLTTRAYSGAVLRELDVLATGNETLSLHYDSTLSKLQDLDYNQALSDFARQQLALEAAQKSFMRMSELSLFNYL